MSKSKNPHGKGKTLISCTVLDEVLQGIDYLACKSGLSRSGWAREAITKAAISGKIFPAPEIRQRNHPLSYQIPKIISLRAAENPTSNKPERSAGA